MQLARVRGNVVASIKAAGLGSQKMLLVEAVSATDPLAVSDPTIPASPMFVAIDLAGAGIGEVVLVSLGSAARVDRDGQYAPTDAAIVAIVDAVQVGSAATFVKH